MDGDNTAKSFEQGANSALKENELASGIHESVKQTVRPFLYRLHQNDALTLGDMQPAAGEKTTGTGTSVFSKDGAVGSMFNGMKSLDHHEASRNDWNTLMQKHSRWSHRWHRTEDRGPS